MLAVDPQTTFKVVLECHKGCDPEPYFIYRYLSARKYRDLKQLHGAIDPLMDDDEAYDITLRMVTTSLVGWSHQTSLDTGELVDFQPERIDEICTIGELMEIVTKVLIAQRPSMEDKKKSSSQSDSDTAKGVSDAPVMISAQTS